MNILIIHAHPEEKSFTHALKNTAVDCFKQQGHQVEVSDLYAMNFNPVASATDFSHPEHPEYLNYALEQRHAVKTGRVAADIQAEIDKVQRADVLIFNFPLYWTSVPAILKGWINRVFVSGIFYGGKRFYNHGGMQGKKAMLCLTLGGREHMFADQNAIHGLLEDYLKPLHQGTLAYAGFDVIAPFIAYHIPYLKDEDRQKILEQYQHYIENIAQQPRLKFPQLEQFDAQLYPLPPQA